MEYLAGRFTDKLVQCNIVKSEDRELYVYGFWQGAILVLNYATVVVVGAVVQMLWQSLVFMLAYGILRPAAGGYHARTQRSCYIFSLLLLLAVLGFLHWFPWNSLCVWGMLGVSATIIFLLAPVEDENKPLDETEQKVYKKRSRWIAIMLSAAAIILLILKLQYIANCITVAVMASSIMLVLGKFKNSKIKTKLY